MIDKNQIRDILKAHATIENGKWTFNAVDLAHACMELEVLYSILVDSANSIKNSAQLVKQKQCNTLCHIVNECGVGHTHVAKVFREKQSAIDYAIEMNGHAEKLKLNVEYRLLSYPME